MKNFLTPFFPQAKTLILAYDHGMEHGPKDLRGRSFDPEYILDLAVKGGYSGIILQKGIAEKYYTQAVYAKKVPLILKLNGKTNIAEVPEPYAACNCSVPYAKKLGAKAVGYTIYLGSNFEQKMMEEFGRIQEEAHSLGLAAIAWLYPRGGRVLDPASEEMVSYAARVGLELGADMIKIKYPKSEEGLKKAVLLAGKTKVVLSGGPKISEGEFFKILENAIKSGVSGLAVGRNVWQSDNPLLMTERIKKAMEIH